MYTAEMSPYPMPDSSQGPMHALPLSHPHSHPHGQVLPVGGNGVGTGGGGSPTADMILPEHLKPNPYSMARAFEEAWGAGPGVHHHHHHQGSRATLTHLFPPPPPPATSSPSSPLTGPDGTMHLIAPPCLSPHTQAFSYPSPYDHAASSFSAFQASTL
ncbi:unnamed protein product [Darwinula stevensoni]|uniref:Uncharacterized protein n=1 Tax=Darwinula stevensoni TaxID=69355 RepID=A0A7R8ZYG7_9CRUS|nr:unnamed protein product [Darwinula stevensoni]CAG0881478.1 unnamed protein product [Darwinula stevensoni]